MYSVHIRSRTARTGENRAHATSLRPRVAAGKCRTRSLHATTAADCDSAPGAPAPPPVYAPHRTTEAEAAGEHTYMTPHWHDTRAREALGKLERSLAPRPGREACPGAVCAHAPSHRIPRAHASARPRAYVLALVTTTTAGDDTNHANTLHKLPAAMSHPHSVASWWNVQPQAPRLAHLVTAAHLCKALERTPSKSVCSRRGNG